MTGPPNYYHALGLSRPASPEQIRAAYVRLLKQYHPDHVAHRALSVRLHAIQQAYRCLRDADSRAEHDRLLLAREAVHQQNIRRLRRRIRRLDRASSLARPKARPRPLLGRANAVMGGSGVLLLLLLRFLMAS